MEVRRFGASCRDLVHIEIKGHRMQVPRGVHEFLKAGFLPRFAQGNLEGIRISVGMATELQPTIELCVVGQKNRVHVRRQHPGGAGHMPLQAGSFETVVMSEHEPTDPICRLEFSRIPLLVCVEKVEQGLPVHIVRVSRVIVGLQCYESAMSYRAVIFDLGGVVLGSPLHAIRDYEREKGIPEGFVNQTVVATGAGGAWSRLERGELGLEEFFPAFDKDCAAAGDAFSAREMMEKIATVTGPRDEMLHAISEIRKQGLTTAALTNNWKSDTADDGVDLLGGYFDVYVESAVEGLRKPDPRIYELTCQRLSVTPDQAVFLDDIGRNLKTARTLGMATIKVDEPVAALTELQELLGFPLF